MKKNNTKNKNKIVNLSEEKYRNIANIDEAINIAKKFGYGLYARCDDDRYDGIGFKKDTIFFFNGLNNLVYAYEKEYSEATDSYIYVRASKVLKRYRGGRYNKEMLYGMYHHIYTSRSYKDKEVYLEKIYDKESFIDKLCRNIVQESFENMYNVLEFDKHLNDKYKLYIAIPDSNELLDFKILITLSEDKSVIYSRDENGKYSLDRELSDEYSKKSLFQEENSNYYTMFNKPYKFIKLVDIYLELIRNNSNQRSFDDYGSGLITAKNISKNFLCYSINNCHKSVDVFLDSSNRIIIVREDKINIFEKSSGEFYKSVVNDNLDLSSIDNIKKMYVASYELYLLNNKEDEEMIEENVTKIEEELKDETVVKQEEITIDEQNDDELKVVVADLENYKVPKIIKKSKDIKELIKVGYKFKVLYPEITPYDEYALVFIGNSGSMEHLYISRVYFDEFGNKKKIYVKSDVRYSIKSAERHPFASNRYISQFDGCILSISECKKKLKRIFLGDPIVPIVPQALPMIQQQPQQESQNTKPIIPRQF